MPEARWNPGAAKASDCEVSKSFCALARRCDEARHPIEAPLIDVCSEAETHRLAAEELHLAFFSIATAESGLKTGDVRESCDYVQATPEPSDRPSASQWT